MSIQKKRHDPTCPVLDGFCVNYSSFFSLMIIFYVSLFYVYYTTATGLGSALEVCRECLKSIAAGCLHLSRVGPVFSRGSHLGNER